MGSWLRVSALAAVAAAFLALTEAFLVARASADLLAFARFARFLELSLRFFCAWCQMKDQNEAQLSAERI